MMTISLKLLLRKTDSYFRNSTFDNQISIILIVSSFKNIKNINYYLKANIQDVYATIKFDDESFIVLDMIRMGMKIRF